MSRDYKNLTGSKAKPASGTSIADSLLPFLTGLSIGLLIAFAVFLYHYRGLVNGVVPDVVVTNSGTTAPATTSGPGPEQEPGSEVPAPTFDFYRILPGREVSLSEWVAEDSPKSTPAAAKENELLILQVGSFKTIEAADKIKAQLAILGIEADVQRVVINGQDVLHRVRIGPFQDTGKFEQTRQRLIGNDLDFMVLKLNAEEASVPLD